MPDEASMTKLANKIINEDLSVRAAEAIAQTSGGSKASKPTVSAGTRTAHLNEIASRLGDRLDTRVSIKLGSKKGLISIEFATVGDLNRILEELGENPFGG
jgi:ParB family chromosome partitioning protein